jgi:hypothetical protein
LGILSQHTKLAGWGHFANTNPSNTLKLLDLEDYTFFNESVWQFIASKYNKPAYFTKMDLSLPILLSEYYDGFKYCCWSLLL